MDGRSVIGAVSAAARFVSVLVIGVVCIAPPAMAQPAEAPGPAATAPARLSDNQKPLGLLKVAEQKEASRPQTSSAKDAVRTVLSLGGVLALVGLAAFAVKRLARAHGGLLGAAGPGGRSPAGVLEVLGRYPLSRGQTLILLKLDRRVLLLSQSSGGRLGSAGLSTLCEITEPDEIASILVKVRDQEGESMAKRFQSVLGSADRRTADAIDGGSARRVATNASGDRVELWDEPRAGSAPGFALLQSDRALARPETGAESLRRRLGSLRRLGEGKGGMDA